MGWFTHIDNGIKKTMNGLIALMFAVIAYGCVSTCETSGQASLRVHSRFEKDGRFGFKDNPGHVVIQPVWDDVAEFACGLCPVNQGAALDYTDFPARRHGGKWGYIDTQGRVAIPLKLDWAYEFTEGLAQVSDGQTRRFIETQGKTVITLDAVSHAGRLSQGLIPVYFDRTGKYVLEPKYNEVHPFSRGVARVHVGGKLREYAVHAPPVWEGGEWQLINRKGEVLKRDSEWVNYPEAVNSPASK